MTQKEFDMIVKNRLEKCEQVLLQKGQEYVEKDRLRNFKDGSQALGEIPERYLMNLVTKHWFGIITNIQRLERGQSQPSEYWTEKIGDIINYMVLLEGLLIERGEL